MIGEVVWGCEQFHVDHLTLDPSLAKLFVEILNLPFLVKVTVDSFQRSRVN